LSFLSFLANKCINQTCMIMWLFFYAKNLKEIETKVAPAHTKCLSCVKFSPIVFDSNICLTTILATVFVRWLWNNIHSTISTTVKHINQILFSSYLKIRTVPQFCDFSIPSFSAVGYSQTWIRLTHSGNALLQGSKLWLTGHQCDQNLRVDNHIWRTGLSFCQPHNFKGKQHYLWMKDSPYSNR